MILVDLKNNKKGFAILETLLYLSFFALLSIVVINAMIVMTKSFKETKIKSEIVQGASVFERISREIKQADSISSLGASDLKLNTKDEFGVSKTVRFVLSGNNVQFFENDIFVGNLNSDNVLVSGLSFTQISTGENTAVKLNMTVQSVSDSLNRTEDFYNTLVLRGGY